MKRSIKYILGLAAMVGAMFFAATSAYGCWAFIIHQRECPKSLILKD